MLMAWGSYGQRDLLQAMSYSHRKDAHRMVLRRWGSLIPCWVMRLKSSYLSERPCPSERHHPQFFTLGAQVTRKACLYAMWILICVDSIGYMPLEPASLGGYNYYAGHPTPETEDDRSNQIWVTPAEVALCCHAKVYHGGGQNFCMFFFLCCTAFIEQKELCMQNHFCKLVPPLSLIEAIWNWHLCHARPPFVSMSITIWQYVNSTQFNQEEAMCPKQCHHLHPTTPKQHGLTSPFQPGGDAISSAGLSWAASDSHLLRWPADDFAKSSCRDLQRGGFPWFPSFTIFTCTAARKSGQALNGTENPNTFNIRYHPFNSSAFFSVSCFSSLFDLQNKNHTTLTDSTMSPCLILRKKAAPSVT